jgi:hypothetical protein
MSSLGEMIVPWQGTLDFPAPVANAEGKKKMRVKSRTEMHFRGRFITANSFGQQVRIGC